MYLLDCLDLSARELLVNSAALPHPAFSLVQTYSNPSCCLRQEGKISLG